MEPNWKNQSLWTGDNLYIMRGMNSESVDLIYLDPPFNSNRDYEAPIGSAAAGAAFKDTWTLNDLDIAWHGEVAESNPALYAVIDAAGFAHGSRMKSYLIMMAVRLLEVRRILKPTGSVYLHCDDTAGRYLNILMDAVFGGANFRNEIHWQRFNFHADAKRLGRVSDKLLFYTKSDRYTFNILKTPYSPRYVEEKFKFRDANGRRFSLDNLNPPAGRGPVYEFHGVTKAWRYTEERMLQLEREGRIYTESRVPRQKRYLDEQGGQAVHSNWFNVSPINSMAKERTGYPTQKPLALLERIIRISSKANDVVMDPFCGCATACVAAEKLERQWCGIDISPNALVQVSNRLRNELGLFSLSVTHRTDIPRRTDLGVIPPYRTQKHTLFGKFEGICQGCLVSFPFRNLTIDHVVPVSRGGTDHVDNLQILCGACNSTKGNGANEEFLVKLRQMGLR